jgi:hypothetical protein
MEGLKNGRCFGKKNWTTHRHGVCAGGVHLFFVIVNMFSDILQKKIRPENKKSCFQSSFH